jgi:hypothetical protein
LSGLGGKKMMNGLGAHFVTLVFAGKSNVLSVVAKELLDHLAFSSDIAQVVSTRTEKMVLVFQKVATKKQ